MLASDSSSATPLLTVEQVAGHYQLAPKTIRAYARAGRIAGAEKVGGQWRFDPVTLAVLPAPHPVPPLSVVHPVASARGNARPRAGSGREALHRAIARPIKPPASRRAAA